MCRGGCGQDVIIKQKMRTLIYILFIINFLSCKAQTNDCVKLSISLKPNLHYTTTIITKNNSTIEYLGNEDLVDNLISKGIDHPITSISTTTMKSNMKTGELTENSFTFETTYDSVSTELEGSISKLKERNKQIEKMQGAKLYGSVEGKTKIHVDSIVELKDETLKATLEQSVSSMLNQIKFPNKEICEGESFTIETPIEIPGENGIVFEMEIINNYKLDSVNTTLAYFTIEQELKTTTTVEKMGFVQDGFGTGQLHYNRQYDSYSLYMTELEMYSMIEVDEIKIRTKAITTSIMKTEVKGPDDNR